MRLTLAFLIVSMCGACGGESRSNEHGLPSDEPQNGGAAAMGATSGSSSGGTGGTLSFVPDQGCEADADCSLDEVCLRYTTDGPSECVARRDPVSSCDPSNSRDQCCSSADCEAGTCFTTVVAAGVLCGLGGYDSYNQCLRDGCESDTDCVVGQSCVPSGFGPLRECMTTSCRTDADCDEDSGGACIAFGDRCCSGSGKQYAYRPKQLTCVYAHDGCQEDGDCPPLQYCVVDGGRAHCSSTCH